MGTRTPMHERFWAKVQRTDGCWLWTGAPNSAGYGQIGKPGRMAGSVTAHRFSAMLHLGMFDQRLFVLHRCDTPLCVRPDHLWLGTHEDNMADMARKRRARNGKAERDRCKYGHELAGDNLVLRKNGWRQCRTCTNTQQNARRKAIA